jgi:CHAD domain-containing protein
MPTPSELDERSVAATVYAEDDKLGPLGGKRPVIDDPAELRRALVGEFQAAADAARDAAGAVDDSPTSAVHDYRKALRRARAVLSLVSDALPRSERRAVRRALRDARRALGSARDHAVAPDAVNALSLEDGDASTMKQILDTAGPSVPPIAEIKQLLAEGAARTAAQVEALEAALPPTVDWASVLRGVCGVYKRARRARKDARSSKRAFHAWRRRTKELAYQLDVLAGYTGSHVTDMHHTLTHATESQGVVVDLIMLRDFARTHGAAVAPEALDSLVHAVNAEISQLGHDSRREARDMFDRSPRRFTKKLAKAARRDTAQAELPDDLD